MTPQEHIKTALHLLKCQAIEDTLHSLSKRVLVAEIDGRFTIKIATRHIGSWATRAEACDEARKLVLAIQDISTKESG